MKQFYHARAKTMAHQRAAMQSSPLTNKMLAKNFGTSQQTVSKWRNRNFVTDLSSRPHNIKYVLTIFETTLICSLRKSSWLPLDEIYEMTLTFNPALKRITVYRCLKRNNLSAVPTEQREKAKKFKAYQPGFLHIDATYLPKINGRKSYLFVAIDRATRLMIYKVYSDKTANSAADFFDACIKFFPFKIEKILTDNGLEFTNRLRKTKNGRHVECTSQFDSKCRQHGVEHRLTPPYSPKTNGMAERANGIIKKGTILIKKYADENGMYRDLMLFLAYYNLYRRHGSLCKELNVSTPYEALQKWHQLEPDIFYKPPEHVLNYLTKLTETG